MQGKHIARLIAALLVLGLMAAMFINTAHTWLAGWGLVVLGAGVAMSMWRPEWTPWDSDGTLTFLGAWTILVLGGLALGLAKGIHWWSLAVAAGSFFGYLLSTLLGMITELDAG